MRESPIFGLVLLVLLSSTSSCAGRHHPALGRLTHQAAPQDASRYSHWKQQQQQAAARQLLQANGAAPVESSNSSTASAALPTSPAPAGNAAVQPSPPKQQPAAAGGNAQGGAGGIAPCPAWAPEVATSLQVIPPLADFNTTKELTVTTDLNAAPDGGITETGRTNAVTAAVTAAVANAAGNASGLDGGQVAVMAPPGLFEPLREDEVMAVYTYLFAQRELNLTPIETAQPLDNYVAWLELAPHNKAAAVAALDKGAEAPARAALALLIQGRAKPPRVTQVRVGPLPTPSSYEYVALAPDGTMEAGWLQRPYTAPESSLTGDFITSQLTPLIPLMKAAYDGWFLDTNISTNTSACTNKCLAFSLGAPFGSGPAQPSGTKVDAGSSAKQQQQQQQQDARFSQRRLWIFFYRNLEGHHLHTVGLEVAFDVAALDPNEWSAGPVWFADTLWPSIDNLVAAWNATMGAGSSGSGSSSNQSASVPADVAERLRTFKAVTPRTEDAIYSTFIPRSPQDATGTAAPSAPTNLSASSGPPKQQPPGPPITYEPSGRRFKLLPYRVQEWMGWSVDIGHKPTTGLSFWNIQFSGERVVYELSLQEAYAGYGGPSPMQAHVQYFDSHWGLGTAYKELVAGVDCPLNAAFMDLAFSFDGGPTRLRNAICVFELPLGMPLLRHWADVTGNPLYYGAVAANNLVIRGISAVYNYDYIQDLLLHLDGSLEVSTHTTGYPQPARFNRAREGNTYGYPLWYDVSGTIHDHLLVWKVDLDIAGPSNSIRMDNIVQEERGTDDGFPQGGVSWFNKQVEQVFPETEAEATLFWNGSSKAAPEQRGKTSLFYIVNEDAKNRYGSARGYRLQHSLTTEQVLPGADKFGNAKAISWSKYKVAVTARREWEQNGASPLNQALPFAPVIDFDDLLLPSSATTQPPLKNATPPTTARYNSSASSSSKGDPIRRQDLVLWVSSGLQHLPGAEDAPVTPSSGPPIGFWLRPFNFFNESAAISQPGSVVYIPTIAAAAAYAAQAATKARNASFSLASTFGLGMPGNRTAPRGLGKDDAEIVVIADTDTLISARRGIQPYVGVSPQQTCLPNWALTPVFNGSYEGASSAPGVANATGAAANGTALQGSAAAGAAGPTGAGRTRGGPYTGR